MDSSKTQLGEDGVKKQEDEEGPEEGGESGSVKSEEMSNNLNETGEDKLISIEILQEEESLGEEPREGEIKADEEEERVEVLLTYTPSPPPPRSRYRSREGEIKADEEEEVWEEIITRRLLRSRYRSREGEIKADEEEEEEERFRPESPVPPRRRRSGSLQASVARSNS
jgi:hypothetical protein